MQTWTLAICMAAGHVAALTSLAAQCPVGGYPISVTAAESDSIDPSYLLAFVRSAAYRWQVPSLKRADFSGWQRIRNRTLPPEPRWADDWAPNASHRAELAVTLYRNGRARAADPSPASGDPLFDRSLRSIASDPMPGAPPVPPFPPGVHADSLRLRISFGAEPDTNARGATARFAAQQSPVRVPPGALSFTAPRGPTTPSQGARRAIVKYDVLENGSIPATSIEFLESSDRDLEYAIRDALLRARLEPAQSNCRAIGMTVVQRFGF